ncbi:unnamed protein product [Clonostachys rosea]|uniref:NmrA-like domain-containing protein n=1 Tax=Bionectria ochroleuca TaxID=29856 RepID=A0ABY6UFQ2_BIOOC|nr:unnamed protein product [Clonostachys rosea]
MAQEIKTVMVLGGLGNLGSYIVPSLLNAGFSVSVLSRGSAASSAHGFDDVPVMHSDYTFSSLVEAFAGQDAVISTIATVATMDINDQKTVIDAAVSSKVKRILPSEFGSDTSTEDLEKHAPFLEGRQEVVQYLRTKETEGLSWTSLCTGAWIDWVSDHFLSSTPPFQSSGRSQQIYTFTYQTTFSRMLEEGRGLLGWDIKTASGTLFDSGNQRFTASTLRKVAEAITAVLLHADETKNQYVQVSSFNLSQNTVWEALEKVHGKPFAMKRMSTADLQALATKHLAGGDLDSAYYELVTAAVYSGSEVIHFPERAAHWNSILGLVQDESLDEMVERVLTKTVG